MFSTYTLKGLIRKVIGDKRASVIRVNLDSLRSYMYKSLKHSANDNEMSLPTRYFDDSDNHVFFGYYDISPFSVDDKILLAMQVPAKKTHDLYKEAKVGFYTLDDNQPTFNEMGFTMTWCWQQGCRLQWYPENNIRTVLFNTIIDDQYGCIVKDIYNEVPIKQIPKPVYTVSKDGRWGLSLNFSRLQRLRPGYGYSFIKDKSYNDFAPRNDGIWRIDMITGGEEFLFSVHDIAQIQRQRSMEGAEHYFNHLLFNHNTSRFLFMHLWINNGKRYGRLLTSDIDGKMLYVLNNEGHSSHYAWKSDTELLAYATHNDLGSNYYLYNDLTHQKEIIGKGALTQDGHPSFLNNRCIITDTYPDKYRNQSLLLYDIEENSVISLGKYFAPAKFTGEIRCDLHPRISTKRSHVCIDAINRGKRRMVVIDIRPLTKALAKVSK